MESQLPDYEELLNACAKYVQQEQGDSNYEVARRWVDIYWGDATKVAGGIRVLEETWNRVFYMRGIFDMQRLIEAIQQGKEELDQLRLRHIDTFSTADEELVRGIWEPFFVALRPRNRNVRPFVGAAKALHLLAPSFFVPFDRKIIEEYRCNIDQPRGYMKFQHCMAKLACHVLDTFVVRHGGDHERARATICGPLYLERTGSHYAKSLAKMLDEYNWVNRL